MVNLKSLVLSLEVCRQFTNFPRDEMDVDVQMETASMLQITASVLPVVSLPDGVLNNGLVKAIWTSSDELQA